MKCFSYFLETHLTMTLAWWNCPTKSTSQQLRISDQCVCLVTTVSCMMDRWPLSLGGEHFSLMVLLLPSFRWQHTSIICLVTPIMITRKSMWQCWAMLHVSVTMFTKKMRSQLRCCVLEMKQGAKTHVRGTQVKCKRSVLILSIYILQVGHWSPQTLQTNIIKLVL